MTTYLYLFSLGMLIFFSTLTGDIHSISIEQAAIFSFLLLLGYAALTVGSFMDQRDASKSRTIFKK